MKFESRGLKVLGYTRRNDRGWEYSETAAQALEKYKAAFPEVFANLDTRGGDIVTSAELCPTADDPDQVIKEMKRYLKANNLVDLEPVSLFAEQLEKETVQMVEKLADHFHAQKTPDSIRRAVVQDTPRQAVLKPSHAIYRLQGQKFHLGDRIIMVQDAAAGGVPLAMKGTVVGIATRDIDVVWDVPFMGGETLQGRCSEYRGSTVPFTSCLNLTVPQFAVDEQTPSSAIGSRAAFKPQIGPRPALPMQNFQPGRAAKQPPVSVMRNPARAPQTVTNGVNYNQAARGVRPPPSAPAPKVPHGDRLQAILAGQERLLQAQRANSNISSHQPPHVAHRPHVVVSPKATANGLPHVQNGQASQANGHPHGDAGASRGRGGRGRGRGRGRGGRPNGQAVAV